MTNQRQAAAGEHGLTPQQILAAGRLAAKARAPYLTALFHSMTPHELEGLGTWGVTENGALMHDTAYTATLTVEECAGLWMHEGSHLFGDHKGRKGTRDPAAWNVACDIAINTMIRTAGFTLPAGGCFPEVFGLAPRDGELSPEEIYEKLVDPKSGRLRKPGAGVGTFGAGDGPPQCGSGTGNPHPAEANLPDALKERSSAEVARARIQAAEAVKSQQFGRAPGFFTAQLDSILGEPKVRWEAVLAKFVRGNAGIRAGSVMSTYTRSARRQAGIGYGAGRPVFAALCAPVPKVTIGVDTSGSMFGVELQLAAREVDGLLKSLNADVQLLACDTRITADARIRTVKEMMPLLKGGGGTAFEPFFDHLTRKKKPDVLVVITDGYGSFPAKPPPYPVAWLLVGRTCAKPPWGKLIRVEQ